MSEKWIGKGVENRTDKGGTRIPQDVRDVVTKKVEQYQSKSDEERDAVAEISEIFSDNKADIFSPEWRDSDDYEPVEMVLRLLKEEGYAYEDLMGYIIATDTEGNASTQFRKRIFVDILNKVFELPE